MFAEDEARLLIAAAQHPAQLAALVDRRVSGLPLEHVVGWAEFNGLRISVDPGVFVPRRRTGFLVAEAAALISASAASRSAGGVVGRPVLVDLCCGSGAVGVAVAAAVGPVELHATDIDPAATRCARRNVEPVGGRVYQGDLYQPLPATLRGRVDVLVANVPYVPTGAVGLLPPEARLHEPMVALDGGVDGLDVLRRVVTGAQRWLATGGHVLVETGGGQAAAAADLCAATGLISRIACSEPMDATVVIGAVPPNR